MQADEAATHNVSGFEMMDDETTEDYNTSKKNAQSLMKLSVLITLNNGQWHRAISREDFEKYVTTHGPAIIFIQYESAFYFRQRVSRPPVNQFYIDLDLSKQNVFDIFERAADSINQSSGVIVGNNSNWVNGTYSMLDEYFKRYGTPFNFIHKKLSYDLMLWLIGIPLILTWLYKISLWIGSKLDKTPEVIRIAIYLYLFVLMLVIFRVSFNYVRYIFLKVEGPKHPNKGPWRHRGVLAGWFFALIGGLFL